MNTASIIINWYKVHKRDLPWRETCDPYFIWISEIVLQQTRVEQGRSYYLKFIQKYPTVEKLASAKESAVLKLWQGLGYYSRARNMHAAAKEIVKKHKGIFPKEYENIRALKGVGDYTAAAVASFAFHLNYPVLDGNVYRFLSRYFGISTVIQSTAAKKEFLSICTQLMEGHAPEIFNQAIMEFGALQCKPGLPDCSDCPLQSSCFAFENKAWKEFPVKNKKQENKNRYFYYLVIQDGKSVYIRQRKAKDIWHNLYEFPYLETKNRLKEDRLIESHEWKNIFESIPVKIQQISSERKHILSHQTLFAKFIEIKFLDDLFEIPSEWKKVKKTNVKKYAVPRLIDKYLEEQSENYS